MEVIRQKPGVVDLDINSNLFKDGGYWGKSSAVVKTSSSSGGKRHSHHHHSERRSSNELNNVDDPCAEFDYSPELSATVRSVALHLEQSLRAAKKLHLSCGEVLLPPDLLTRVARDIIRMAETEPCGIRGCLILLNFDPSSSATNSGQSPRREIHSSNSSLNSTSSSGSASSSSENGGTKSPGTGPSVNGTGARNIGRVRWDSQTVTTFELHLTLREESAPWYSRLPQILRNLTKGGTIVVSPAYTIAKKKLYRSHC